MSTTFLHKLMSLEAKKIIAPVDAEFCRFLAEVEPEIHDSVLLAGCLVGLAYRNGDVCIFLDEVSEKLSFGESGKFSMKIPDLEEWLGFLRASGVVGVPGDFKPLILDNSHRLYFHKRWQHEQALATFIHEKANGNAPIPDVALLKDGIRRLFKEGEEVTDWQKVASVMAVNQLFTIISGGPGTGKTRTVVRLLILLLEQGRHRGKIPAVALAAPTGKAAIRLQESIENIPESLTGDKEIGAHIPGQAVTLHNLLGASRYTTKFRYNEENPLPYDCVIVDEASMVDQTLMIRLMQALSAQTRLILLGDKDQLASVEAGSVLGDICGGLPDNRFTRSANEYLQKLDINLPEKYVSSSGYKLNDHINLLKKSYRFSGESGIGRLVEAIHSGDSEKAWNLLLDEHFPDIKFIPFKNYKTSVDILFAEIERQFRKVKGANSPGEMLDVYHQFKILGAHRKGPWGVETINRELEQRLQRENLVLPNQSWYDGRPLIINTNDYSLGLSNGDMGVCKEAETNRFVVFFDKRENGILLPVERLPDFSSAFALTVHKSQGSEFDDILLVLPDVLSRLLHREMLYTAISRARNGVTIIGTKEAFTKAVTQHVERHSGLREKLWKQF